MTPPHDCPARPDERSDESGDEPLTDPPSVVAANPYGLCSRRRAVAALGRRRVDGLIASGALQSPWPGVVAPAGVELDLVQRSAAALLASGGIGARRSPDGQRIIAAAVLCGRSAARWWGLPLIDDDDPCAGADERRLDDVHTWTRQRDLVVPVVGGRPRELRRHRLTLGPDDLRVSSGIWVLSPVATLFDCSRLLSLDALVCANDNALFRRLCTLDELRVKAAERVGDAGAPRFRAALELADARAESPGESLTRLLLTPYLPNLVPQVRVRNAAGHVIARLDLGDKGALFGVEFDGKVGHSGAQMVAKDRRRDRRTGREGWWTERVTWSDVRVERQSTVERVVEEHTRWAAVTGLRRGRS